MRCSLQSSLCAAYMALVFGAGSFAETPPSRVAANDTVSIETEVFPDREDESSLSRAPWHEQLPLGAPRSMELRQREEGVSQDAGQDETAGGGSILQRIDPRASDVVQVLSALAAVIGLALFLKLAASKLSRGLAGSSRPSGVLEVLARYPIARGQQLILLKLGRRIVLAHATGGSMRTLTEVTDSDEVAALLARIEAGSSGRDSLRFRSILNQFKHEHDMAQQANAPRSAAELSRDGGEIVDLTRAPGRGFFSWGRATR